MSDVDHLAAPPGLSSALTSHSREQEAVGSVLQAWRMTTPPPPPWCVPPAAGTLLGVPWQQPVSRQVFRGADAGNLLPFLGS